MRFYLNKKGVWIIQIKIQTLKVRTIIPFSEINSLNVHVDCVYMLECWVVHFLYTKLVYGNLATRWLLISESLCLSVTKIYS